MLESTMAQVSGSLPSPTSRGSTRWAALRPTRQFRRRLFQAFIVTVLFLAFVGGLTVLFGTIILQYAVGGLVVSSIVIVAAIGLTVLYGIRGFANFAYGDLMTLGAYLALLLSLNGLSLIWGAIVSFLVLAVVGVLLELVKATGIDTKRVTYAAWVVSCSFASTAGVLLGLGTALNPTMGFDIILLIFAAVIVGGIGSPYGAMLGGLLVGLSQEMSVPFLLWLERLHVIGLQFGTAYKVAIPFIILFVVLIFRPWGIAGRRPAFARRSYFIEQIARLLGERRRSETPTGEANGGR